MVRLQINYMVPVTTAVVHQKQEGSCSKVASTDMMTIIIRMNDDDFDCDYDQTPEICIDRDGDIRALCHMYTRPQFSLEKTNVNPWCRLPRKVTNYIEEIYETPPHERFRIEDIIWVSKRAEVELSILEMFRDGGDGYTIVGIMVMGRFKEPTVAKAHNIEGLPYRHAADEDLYGVRHALLIFGLNTMSQNEQEHYCILKNSYGEKWGNKGYNKVGIVVFIELFYPVQPRPNE